MTTLGHRLCIVERDEARRECERLRGLLAAHGIDPDVVDVRPAVTAREYDGSNPGVRAGPG